MLYKNRKILSLFSAILVLAGCSTNDIQPRGRLDYLQASSVNPLELPPDLVASRAGQDNRTATLLSQYNQQVAGTGKTSENRVLNNADTVRIERSGGNRWIATSLPADLVWTKSMQLFQELGLNIEMSNPEAGIAETSWAENRADVPETFLRKMLARAMDQMFSAPTRDKFKLRLERDGGQILVYVTHYGMRDKTSGRDDELHTWVDRPRDTELEAEILSRLVVKLGGRDVKESVRSGTIAVEQSGNDLVVNREFRSVWTQVGNVLDDGSDFSVESQDRENSSYTVVWRDPKKKTGSRLAFWKSRQPVTHRFNVAVIEQGKQSTAIRIQALDRAPISVITERLRTNLH